jgi:hypothetical protein
LLGVVDIDSESGAMPVPIVVHLTIEPGEPLRGSIAVSGGAQAAEFDGWIELMSAITAARARTADGPSAES